MANPPFKDIPGLDHLEEATRQAQQEADERLRTQQATIPGLPAPADPTWLAAELKKSAAVTDTKTQAHSNHDTILQPRNYSKPNTVAPRRYQRGIISNELEAQLGVGEWEAVYEAFQHTGSEKELHKLTGIDIDSIWYLLDTGVRRLRLPAIRDHAINDAEVQRQLEEHAPNLINALNPELDIAEVQTAATKRAVEDAMIAAHSLELSAKVGGMLEGWANKMQSLMSQGAFSHPHQVTPELLTSFVKALETHSRATERAIKMYRLTRGEPTENIAHQVAGLLVDCTLEELQEADRKGTIPARILSRFGAQIVDVPEEDFAEVVSTDKDKDIEDTNTDTDS